MSLSTMLRTLALALAALTVFGAAPARAEWLRAETEHFIVYGNTSERQLRSYAQKVERFDTLLRSYYPINVEYAAPKLEIYLAEGARDMNRASPGISNSVGGYYSSNSGRIYAVVDNQAIGGDVVLFHEYAHHFMFQMQADAYPSWFVEGFAEYYATADVRPDRIQFGSHHPGRMLALTQAANSWARMEDVLTWKYLPSGRYPAGLYYAQAWAMTHYFMSTPERTRMLGQYLALVTRGEDSVAAMRQVTGRTPEQLQTDIRRYLMGSIRLLTPELNMQEPAVAITRLTPAEADMVWLDIRLDNTPVRVPEPVDDPRRPRTEAQKAQDARERAERRATLIADAFAAADRRPGDRMALLTRARAQRLSGDPTAALATLEPLIQDASTDADALRLAALALLDQLREDTDPEDTVPLRRQANVLLGRAMEADPLDYRTYLALNTVRQGLPGYPNDNDLAALHAAVGLAPQAFDGRLRLGRAYMDRNMNAEAIAILRPVANSPHRSAYSQEAQTIINTAREALGQDAEAYEPPPPEEGAEAAPSSSEEQGG